MAPKASLGRVEYPKPFPDGRCTFHRLMNIVDENYNSTTYAVETHKVSIDGEYMPKTEKELVETVVAIVKTAGFEIVPRTDLPAFETVTPLEITVLYGEFELTPIESVKEN